MVPKSSLNMVGWAWGEHDGQSEARCPHPQTETDLFRYTRSSKPTCTNPRQAISYESTR